MTTSTLIVTRDPVRHAGRARKGADMRRLAIFMSAIVLTTAIASAQVAVFDAATYGQVSNVVAQQQTALTNQTKALNQQFTQLQAELQAGQPLDSKTWGQAAALISTLGSLLNQAHMVVVQDQNLVKSFTTLYPTYVPPQNYAAMYAMWDKATQSAAQQALSAAQAHMQQVPATNAALATQTAGLQAAALAHNRDALIEAGVQTSQMLVAQMQELQTSEALRTQYEVLYYQQQLARSKDEDTQNQAVEEWMARGIGQAVASPSPAP